MPYLITKFDSRLEKAKSELSKPIVEIKEIINLTNIYLEQEFNISTIDDPFIYLDKGKFQNKIEPKDFYSEYKLKYNLTKKQDIIWMKFTKCGHLSTVCCSNDINLWYTNTSGKLIKKLNLIFNEEFVLVFPLPEIKGNSSLRHQIELEVGNNLINNGVPIIDFYSHRIQPGFYKKKWYINNKENIQKK